MTDAWTDEDPQAAMLLTQQEWADLAHICASYSRHLLANDPGDRPRIAALCQRIVDAA